ncbi:MAG: DEAD/DEAH box helicase [Desulfocapsaceae bacterium]|nr:DEAD/DEAH box helicase [Desulfocapsaceae bacterium]
MIKVFLKKVGNKLRNIARSGKKDHGNPAIAQPVSPAAHNLEVLPEQALSGAQLESPAGEAGSRPRRPPRPKRERQVAEWDLAQFQVEPVAGKTRFHDLDLPLELMHAIADLEFQFCTPIQAQALPDALLGRDLIGRASTGTGKSAVFLIAIFTRLLREQERGKAPVGTPRALIIAPTRELVIQIAKDAKALAKYTNLKIVSAYGGTDYQKQEKSMTEQVVDVVVATPGRLLDFESKKIINLNRAAIMVIDEADRMLDMGFIPDVRRIIYKTPPKEKRQTMLFSATFTDEVKQLSAQWCKDPITVETEADQVAVDTVQQIVYLTTTAEKFTVLYNLIANTEHERIMVFTNMKNEARRLSERLERHGVKCTLLSGDVPQEKRTSRLEAFREGRVKVMIATDVAGRGIHITGISHVINYTLPYEPEDYVHRIGRTGRAGVSGISISFACEEDAFYLPEIEAYIGEPLHCIQPDESLLIAVPAGQPRPSGAGGRDGSGHGRSGGGGSRGGSGSRSGSYKGRRK